MSWDPPPRVIGHRGAPTRAPENTLASFHAALAEGAVAVECDARLSADGQVVLHHDAELGRIVRGEGRVEDLEAATLRAMGVALLSEVLALPLLVNVEIKGDATNAHLAPRAVAEEVRRADALARVLVTSFDPALADAYARETGGAAGAIVPFAPEPADLDEWPRLRVIALAQDAALPEVIAYCQAAGRRVLVWTVNDERSAEGLLAAGADGIITDRPGPLLRGRRAGATGSSPAP